MATSKADEYRAKAREAEQLAERTNDSVIKEHALKIAEQWRYMAASKKSLGDLRSTGVRQVDLPHPSGSRRAPALLAGVGIGLASRLPAID
jgi:hypothetical protein